MAVKLQEEQVYQRAAILGVEIVEYGGLVNSKSRFKCLKNGCDYQWVTTFGSLWSQGCGCPKCAGTARVTHEDVVSRLTGRSISLLHYSGTTQTKSTFACTKEGCGHVWSAKAANVLSIGQGCPKCAGRMPVVEDDARSRLQGKNIELLSYAGRSTLKSTFKCLEVGCGHVWKATLCDIQSGKGCPACAKYGFNPSKPAYFYAYRVTTRHDEYFGFGVTNDIVRRDNYHKRSFESAGASGELLFYHKVRGAVAREFESRLKARAVVNSGVEGFVLEAFDWDDNLPAAIEWELLCASEELSGHFSPNCVV